MVGSEAVAVSSDWFVIGTVILARLVLPLLIPKYPLPAILACLLVDGVDLYDHFGPVYSARFETPGRGGAKSSRT
jgi:hypothetical protein